MIRYQWIKFKKDAVFYSEDFDVDDWHLVSIDTDWPNGGVELFGVEYCMRQSDIEQYGAEVSDPNKSKNSKPKEEGNMTSGQVLTWLIIGAILGYAVAPIVFGAILVLL